VACIYYYTYLVAKIKCTYFPWIHIDCLWSRLLYIHLVSTLVTIGSKPYGPYKISNFKFEVSNFYPTVIDVLLHEICKCREPKFLLGGKEKGQQCYESH
jgi:hypothetical protein